MGQGCFNTIQDPLSGGGGHNNIIDLSTVK